MDSLQEELAELKSFIADLKADRAAQKEKEQRETWTKYTSMSLVLLAVLAAVATQWGGKCSSRTLVFLNDSTFNQAKASDQPGQIAIALGSICLVVKKKPLWYLGLLFGAAATAQLIHAFFC
jgi:hypothetical protein